ADQLAAPAATTLTVGDDLPTVAAATKDGYTVTGWTYYDANNTEITDGKMPAGNVTAKATQSGIAYSLNYNVLNDTLPEGFVRPTDDNDYYIGDTVNLVTVTVPDGYEFSGWKIDDEPVSSVTFETSDIEVVGELTKIPYTLTYEYTYENVKAADQLAAPAATTLTVGDDLPTVAAATKDGYTVTGWTYYDANNTEITDGKMPAGNVTAKATQSGIAYSLTYTVTGVAPASFVAPTDNADYYIGDTVTLATVAPVEGYTFSGWKLNGADATTVTFETSDIEVTGVWTINSWTADFLDVDGTRLATDTFNYGATITNKPADPENFGYEFGGWVDSTTYGEPTTFTAGMTMPDHDVAFKLVMTPIDYLVTFVKDGETVYSEELPYDSEIPEPEVNTDKTGYDFIGWFDADDNEYLPGTTVPGEVTYTAVYEGLPVNYSIVKNFQDADWDTPAGTDYVAAPATTATATAGSTVNVDFDAYDVEDGFTLDRTVSDATAEIAGDGSTVVNLYYTRNTVTGTIDGVEDTYYVGQTIASAEVQNPDPGLNYTGWEDADTEQAVSFPYTVPDRDFVLDPVSEPNVFTLTFVDEDGETVIGEPQQVAYGAQLAEYKPADPEKDGYEFSGWSDVDTGEQLPETMPAKNATYKAVYRADSNMSYTITVYVMDVAGNYTSTSTTAYGATGSPVTIQPGNMVGYAVNYESSHLSDFIAGDGTTELTIYYDLAAYEVTFFNEGGETAYDGPTEVLYGATIPVPATAPEKEGYNFVKWVDAEENDVPATMPAGAQSFYPVFAKAEYTITFIVNGAQTVVTYEFEDEVAVPENPVIDGMTFQGWTPEIPETMPAENLIIVAEFDKAAYTVNFVDYDGTPILTSLVDVGTPIGTPSTNPSREYYNFTGWDGYTAGMTMPAQDVTFTATYERVPVKLIPAEGSTTVIERLVGGEAVIESYNDDSVTTDGYAAEDFTGWYVYGLDEMINEQDLLNDYLAVQGDGSISIEPFSGKRGFYGTGATVTVTDNVTNEVVETFTIIVFGDLNGDAYITSDDTMMMRSELSGDTFWSDDLDEEYNAARTRAADLNGDGFVATNDRSILYNATLGTILLDQTTGLVATD
ncbi:MAG: InlB B-repeat-containing protein, partial [Clostridia bacterium]|nr:InlB B-repeat-containing protein [Clostridia bacterium]